MIIKHIANLIKHRHNLWDTQLFSDGWREGYGMGKMDGQKMAYARLLKVIHNLDPIAYRMDVEKQMILDEIVKEMWGFYDK